MSRSRRSLLRLCAVSLSVAVAGCSEAGGPEQTPSPSPSPSSPSSTSSPVPSESPSSTTECDAVELPRPTPTAEGLEPLPYPDYPEALTAETARAFVTGFERAYQHNRFLAGSPAGTDLILMDAAVPEGFVIESSGGYLVGVESSIATEDNRGSTSTGTGTPTAVPSYDDEFAAWYHLTPRRVRRKEVGSALPETPGDVDMAYTLTVRCV